MRFLRPAILSMTGYVPGEQPKRADAIKLNANENPYPPPAAAVEAMRAALAGLRLYPESTSRGLREAAAAPFGLALDRVMAANGSDEMLRILFQACLEPGAEVVAFSPSYTYYRTLAAIQGAAYREIEFTGDYELPRTLDAGRARLVLLPNPNAPSGTLFPEREIRRLCAAFPDALVVIDEAYADFAGVSAIPLIGEIPHLFVVRTLSKSHALAGLRVGLGFGRPELLAELEKVRDYYNLDRVAQAGGEAALRDRDWLREVCSKVAVTRARLTEALTALGAFVWPSAANFVLARFSPADRAKALLLGLKERNILVRWFDAPRLRDCLRITVGTDAENDALLAAMRDLLRGA